MTQREPLVRRRGTIALSWGRSGGFYLHRQRLCLGRVALTYVPAIEIDDLMKAYAGVHEDREAWAVTWLCKHCEGTGTLTDGITDCLRCDGRGATT